MTNNIFTSFVILAFGIGLVEIYKFFMIPILDIPLSDDSENDFNQMYKIIETKGQIDKDIYNRTIDPNVVKKFCLIAKKLNINLSTITDLEFNIIYKKYVQNQIKKSNKK